MDIIDIMLAKAMTPQGKTDAYVAKANKAAAKAEKAEQDAAAAIATVEAAASTIEETQSAAETLLATAQETLETVQAAQINTLDTEDVDAEVKKMTVNTNVVDGVSAKTVQVITTYPDNTLNTQNVTKLYKGTGQNEDGTMTQKAITNTLDDYASKSYVSSAIAAIPTGNSGNVTINFSTDDAGHLVEIDEDGHLTPSTYTSEDVLEALVRINNYVINNSVGLEIDYLNRTFTRTQEATNKSMGQDFNSYIMYGGRTRCNVADDGTINAFYGENGYTEDGSNGQVMVYQPKFYYKRLIHSADGMSKGSIVRHETLILSAEEQPGFKLAPIFAGNLDYVLLPAFDAGLVDNKLVSIAGVKPITNLTVIQAETYANARGNGWHIMNLAAESANQMLEMVEFGTMNGQSAIEQGLTYLPNGNNAYSYITGSTSTLGNGTGHAASTQVEISGTTYTMNTDGYRAISYRGMENPWGNLWSMIGGVNVSGNGSQQGGTVYVCTDFNYTPSVISSNYQDIGLNLPSVYGWINAMGYANEAYDWVYLPAECSDDANSLSPVGDGLWTYPNLNHTVALVTGGACGFKEECGPFYYGADRPAESTSRPNYGAKLLYIPTKNAIYTANIAKWNTYMGE